MGLCLGRRYKCNTEIFQMPNFSGISVGDKVMPQLGVQHGVFYLVQRIWGWHSDLVDLVTPGWVRLDCERSWLQGSNKLKPVPWTKHTKQGVVKGVWEHHENIPRQQFQIRSFTSSSRWPIGPTSHESHVPQVAGQHSFSISEGASCPSPSGAFEATPMRPSSIERGLVYALKHRYVPTAAEYVMNESQLTHSYAMEMDRLLADVKTTDATYSVKQCGFVWFICTISMYKLGWHARTPSYIMNMTIIMAIIMTIIVAIITIMIMIMIKHAHHDDHDKFITVSQGWWFHDFPRIFPHFFMASHPKANYANVAALTADALMNTCPWDYWVPGVPDPGANGSTQLQLRPAAKKATCFSPGLFTLW